MKHRSADSNLLVAVVAIALALFSTSAHAQINTLPPELENVGVTEHLNGPVPGDALFRDHHGNMVRLGQYFDGRRPVLLNLVYFRCPMLCSMVMNATLNVLSRTAWTVGEQFDVVTISIDPRDDVAGAAQKRRQVLERYGRAPAQRGWHFLTGDEATIRRVADAVGFQYRYDARQGQYAHPAVIFLLTPSGRVARYLYGIEYNPNDVRLGLLEASEGRSITTVERLIMFCYHYDPQGRKYVLLARRVMQLGGAATMLLLGGLLAILWLRERRKRRGPTAGPRGEQRGAQSQGGNPMTPATTPQEVRG
jgi:protein SCO1/2